MKPAMLLIAVLVIVVSVSLLLGTGLLAIVPSQIPTPDSQVLYGMQQPASIEGLYQLNSGWTTGTGVLTSTGRFTGISVTLTTSLSGTYSILWWISCGAEAGLDSNTVPVLLTTGRNWYTFQATATGVDLTQGTSCSVTLSSSSGNPLWQRNQDPGTANGFTLYIWGKSIPAAPPPEEPLALVASFTYKVTGLKVAFTDTSAGTPTSWAWTFGDGLTGTGPTANKTYSVAGTYSVKLTTTRASDGATSTAVASVSVSSTAAGSGSSSPAATEGTEEEVPCDPITETVENGVCVPIPQPFPWALLVLAILIILISLGVIVIIINLFG